MKQLINPDDSSTLVSDCLQLYWHGHVRDNTVSSTSMRHVLVWLDKCLGEYRVSDLRAVHFKRYLRDRLNGSISGRAVKTSTVRRELGSLKAAFTYCVNQKQLPPTDVPFIKLPPVPKSRSIWLSDEQVTNLTSYLEEQRVSGEDQDYLPIHIFVLIALGTGARKSSIEDLLWSHIDFDAKMVRFDLQVDIETRKRKVAVPMSDSVFSLLNTLRSHHPNADYVMGRYHPVRHTFNRLKREMSVRFSDETYLDMTPHTLRHTTATQLLRHGASVWQVSGILGDSVSTIIKTYGHHVPDHLREGLAKWDVGS